MRQFLRGMLLLFASCGQGVAASLVALPAEPPARASSVIVRGAPVAQPVEAQPLQTAQESTDIFRISPSMIVFGAEAIPTASEPVASIAGERTPEKPRWTTTSTPLIIRGGMIGDAFATPVAPEAISGETADNPAAQQTPLPGRKPSEPDASAPATDAAPAPLFREPG